MSLHRLIFRLDFDPVFQVIDSVGKILDIFQGFKSKGDDVWPMLGENIETRSISGQAKSTKDGWFRSLTIEPTSIVGEFESLEGIPLDSIENSELFRHLEVTTNALKKEFHLTKFQRIGIRFYIFSKEFPKDNANKFVSSFIADTAKTPLFEVFGESTDTGIAIDGLDEDGVNYHFNFGPHNKEFRKVLRELPKTEIINDSVEDLIEQTGLLFDIDLFVKRHYLAETTRFSKWCLPLFEKADKGVNVIKSLS
jgi:hypothetical protein